MLMDVNSGSMAHILTLFDLDGEVSGYSTKGVSMIKVTSGKFSSKLLSEKLSKHPRLWIPPFGPSRESVFRKQMFYVISGKNLSSRDFRTWGAWQ